MNTVIITVISAAISALISGVIGYAVKRSFDNYFLKKEKERKEQTQKVEELDAIKEAKKREDRRTDIKEVVNPALAPIIAKIDSLEEKLALTTEADVTLLRDRMKCSLSYCRKQGYASTTDKANWNELYNSYKKLGGNHFREYVNQWKQEMEDFPIDPPITKRISKKTIEEQQSILND